MYIFLMDIFVRYQVVDELQRESIVWLMKFNWKWRIFGGQVGFYGEKRDKNNKPSKGVLDVKLWQ